MNRYASPRLADRTDEQILGSALAGNAIGFEELLRRYRALLYRCITRITTRYERVLGSEDADEIYAEVCYALWSDNLRRLRAYDAGRGMKLGSWLGLIASHSTYDFLRRVARRPQCDDLEHVPERPRDEPSALDHLLEGERRASLHTLTNELSARDQEFVVHYFGADEDPEKVASELGISVKTVYSKKNKITTRLLRRAAEVRLAA